MSSVKILVIDDDPDVLGVVRDTLRLAGYESEATTDSVSAAARIEIGGYDLILSDIVMPDLDGLQLLALVKRASPRTEVILITGQSTQERALEAVSRGAFAYLQKPLAIDDLLSRVKQALWKQAVTEGKSD